MVWKTLRRWTMAAMGASFTVSSVGCLSCLSPIDGPPPAVRNTIDVAPQGCKNGVHIFLVNGVDPLDCGKMSGVRHYLGRQGFPKTYLAQPYHAHWLVEQISQIREADPNARVAVVAWDWGAPTALSALRTLREQQYQADLLFLLDPCGVNEGESIPCSRTFHLRADSALQPTAMLSDCQNVTVAGAGHCSLPSHPLTLEWLIRELNILALTVPQTQTLPGPVVPLVEPVPPPRPVKLSSSQRADEWDFLKPRFSTIASTSSVGDQPTVNPDPNLLPAPQPGRSESDRAKP